MRIRCKLLAIALASLTLVSAADAQTTLRYQFKAGEKVPYTLEQVEPEDDHELRRHGHRDENQNDL